MSSDEDFLETSFVSSKTASKNKKRDRAKVSAEKKPQRTPKKAKVSPSSSNILTVDRASQETSASYCVNCQMPFNLLHRWESPEVHASSCLETDFSKLPACLQGLRCDNTIRSHFAKWNHLELASHRDESSTTTSSSELCPITPSLPKFKFKKTSAKMTSSEETKEQDSSHESKSAPSEKCNEEDAIIIVPDSPEPNFDTAREAPDCVEKIPDVCETRVDPNFSDEDDSLFEQLTNQALQIDAVQDQDRNLEIKVKVDPNVDLSTLVMKIPSKANQIDIIGRVTGKKQGTLDSFFGLKPKQPFAETNSTKATTSQISNGKSSQFSLQGLNYGDVKQRVCPFYKKIPETPFAVDAFSYGNVPGISHYFLSHFHYDHYGGMTKHWNQPVICSQITAKLILLKIRMDQSHLRILHLNDAVVIENVEVTLLDANHCPGSVMFLFKLPNNGKVVLHTGDFRACPEMEEYPDLWNNKIDKLYLDTTYCKPEYDFPNQTEVIATTVELVKSHLRQYPKTLICVGSYTIGKERIFIAIAKELDARIWGSSDKIRVLKTLSDPLIDEKLTKEAASAQIHVVEMFKVKKKDALLQQLEQLKKLGSRYEYILGIVPTGWTHEKGASSTNLTNMVIKNLKQNVFQLNVPYSEHSSYGELQRFVNFLKLGSADKILATVNVGNPSLRNMQKSIFKKWIQEANQPTLKFKS